MTLKSIFCIQLKNIFTVICRQDFRLPNCVSILLNSFVNLSRYTYTNDERFRAIHKVKSEDYMLQILPIQVLSSKIKLDITARCWNADLISLSFQKSDEGWFECQISSTPVISHLVYLNIAGRPQLLSFEYSQLPFKV